MVSPDEAAARRAHAFATLVRDLAAAYEMTEEECAAWLREQLTGPVAPVRIQGP